MAAQAMTGAQNFSRFVHWGRNIVAVGRNYRDHCKELGNAVPTKPMLFMKPPSSYLEEGTGPILVNGESRQDGTTSDMVFPIATLVSYISKYFTLHPGDLVLTGTPAGVGPVTPGDTLTAGLGDILTMEFSISKRE
ncbi:Acylpyruvase FAHD1, mitochondrial [Portunus trituberculatus]|uniref:oxaloacetate tautomerase n=1 Tax=Portunus trituberculatus TaxID=210409 RepID=A0A5B7ESP0_PORTR|nr:Acylpyruvase FAHD1, mitochondrial [Portunus trituberculatus]